MYEKTKGNKRKGKNQQQQHIRAEERREVEDEVVVDDKWAEL